MFALETSSLYWSSSIVDWNFPSWEQIASFKNVLDLSVRFKLFRLNYFISLCPQRQPSSFWSFPCFQRPSTAYIFLFMPRNSTSLQLFQVSNALISPTSSSKIWSVFFHMFSLGLYIIGKLYLAVAFGKQCASSLRTAEANKYHMRLMTFSSSPIP